MSVNTVTFRGRSGEQYRFHVYMRGTRFKRVAAVCVLSKRVHNNRSFERLASHECLHIGQTPDLSSLSYDASCFKGADCICVYLAKDEDHRLYVEGDLLASFGIWNPHCRVDLTRGLSPSGERTAAAPMTIAPVANAAASSRPTA